MVELPKRLDLDPVFVEKPCHNACYGKVVESFNLLCAPNHPLIIRLEYISSSLLTGNRGLEGVSQAARLMAGVHPLFDCGRLNRVFGLACRL